MPLLVLPTRSHFCWLSQWDFFIPDEITGFKDKSQHNFPCVIPQIYTLSNQNFTVPSLQ